MEDKEVVKEAFAAAEKDAREKQVEEVKRIVTKTLEKLDAVKKELKANHEQERILKMDIEDLKEGRLDRIAERQEKDPEAKKVSVVVIIKEKEIIREYIPSPWYFPYQVIWQTPYVPTYTSPIYTNNTIHCTSGGTNFAGDAMGMSVGGRSNCTLSDGSTFHAEVASHPTISCSVAKAATVGAYTVGDHIVHLR